MVRALAIWVGMTLLGSILIVSLPERLGSSVLFRLSDRHGPSAADAAGLVVIFVGWFVYIRALWLRRRSILPYWAAATLILTATLGIVGCLLSAAANYDSFIVGGAFIAAAAQLGLGLLVKAKA